MFLVSDALARAAVEATAAFGVLGASSDDTVPKREPVELGGGLIVLALFWDVIVALEPSGTGELFLAAPVGVDAGVSPSRGSEIPVRGSSSGLKLRMIFSRSSYCFSNDIIDDFVSSRYNPPPPSCT